MTIAAHGGYRAHPAMLHDRPPVWQASRCAGASRQPFSTTGKAISSRYCRRIAAAKTGGAQDAMEWVCLTEWVRLEERSRLGPEGRARRLANNPAALQR